MAIVQVSERIIKSNYQTLEEYLKKDFSHNESNLYYKNGLVYKIFNKMLRLYRQSYMWILDQNTFSNSINIESLLYQGDKLIGCTTKFYENLRSLNQIIKEQSIGIYEAKKIYEILEYLQKQLLEHNLCYIDPNLSNICFSNDSILVTDLDGVYYNPDKNIIDYGYINFFKTYLSLIFNENIFQYESHIQKTILQQLFNEEMNLESIKTSITDMSETKADFLNEKYYKLKKDSFHYHSK